MLFREPAQITFCPLGVGQVAYRAANQQRPATDLTEGEFDRELGSVCTHPSQFQTAPEQSLLARLHEAREGFAMKLTQRRRHDQFGQRSPECLVTRVTESALGCRIELDDAARGVNHDDAVERSVQVRA